MGSFIKRKSGRRLAEKQRITKNRCPPCPLGIKQGFHLPWPLCKALPLVSQEQIAVWYENCTAAWGCTVDKVTRMRSQTTTPRKCSNGIPKHTGSALAAIFQVYISLFLQVIFFHPINSTDFPKARWQVSGNTESKDPLAFCPFQPPTCKQDGHHLNNI